MGESCGPTCGRFRPHLPTMARPSGWYITILTLGMLLTGSINTLSKKLAYNQQAVGQDGEKKKFSKPWTLTLVMFSGELMTLLYYFGKRAQARRQRARSVGALNDMLDAPLLADDDFESSPGESRPGQPSMSPMGVINSGGPVPDIHIALPPAKRRSHDDVPLPDRPVSFREAAVCLLPAMCDVGGTTLSGIGLLWTTASVYQMLRGSIIPFTAVLSVIFLKRKLYAFHWLGVLLTVIGIFIVGFSGYEADKSGGTVSGSKSMLGNLLVVLAQLMSASQMVIEEKWLKGRPDRPGLPPALVVGTEGAFGVIMMLAIILPIVAHLPGSDGDGVHENAIDAAVMLGHNWHLALTVGAYWLSIAFYNFCSLSVAKSLSSVVRCLIDACRIVAVWSIDLVLFYSIPGNEHKATPLGERWHAKWSWVQIAGFLALLCGTLIYNAVLRVPCLWYPDEDLVGDDKEAADALRNAVVVAPALKVGDSTPLAAQLLRGDRPKQRR